MVLVFKNVILKFLVLRVLSFIRVSKGEKVVEEKCYDGLGCVRLTPEWFHPRYRPENVFPSDRHAVNAVFVLWTFNKMNVTPEILGSDLRGTHINCCLKIFVHDFTSNGYTGWIQHLSHSFLSNPETSGSNIVSVDWAAGAEPPYILAAANARLVALEVVHFLNKLKALYKLDSRKVHIIGHGLGGHIAGYVGKLTPLYKITALDPSGPYFTNMPPQVRLHRDDAKFVEVVHSDASPRGQGTPELLGNVDFFPNGGRCQPGCVESGRKVTSVQRGDLLLGETLTACSHKRSLKYYIESFINKSCKFVAVSCRSFKDFVKGKCLSCGENYENCVVLNPTSRPRILNNSFGFYFVTSDSSPFCGEMIKVVLELRSDPKTRGAYVKGHFDVTIPQAIGDVHFLLNENHVVSALRANEQHVFLVFRSTPPPLELPARSVQLQWVHGWMPCSWCTPPKITGFMIHKMSDLKEKAIQWFCPLSEQDPGFPFSLHPCKSNYSHKLLTDSLTSEMAVTVTVERDYYENRI